MGQPRVQVAMTHVRDKIINSLHLELILNALLFKNILYHENVMAKLC